MAIDTYASLVGELSQVISRLSSQARVQTIPRGEIISRPGDHGYIHLVSSGRVELYEVNRFGKKFIYTIARPGVLWGDLGCGIPQRFFARALFLSEIMSIRTSDFVKYLGNHPELSIRLCQYFGASWAMSEHKAASIAYDRSLTRLVQLLLHLGQPTSRLRPDEQKTDRLTMGQIASMIGLTRQTTCVLTSLLEQKGLVWRKNKSVFFERSRLVSWCNTSFSAKARRAKSMKPAIVPAILK